MKKLKGAWIVTFQDCEQIRAHFSGYHVKAVTRANGIGNNAGTIGRVYREVIITDEASGAATQRRKSIA